MTQSNIIVHKYTDILASEWETFLSVNECFSFQFRRRFLDIYSSEVIDTSYIIRESSGEILAVIAIGKLKETKQLISHPKSSFGGFIYRKGISIQLKELIYFEFLKVLSEDFTDYTLEIRTPMKAFNPLDSAEERWLLWRFGFSVDQVVLHSFINLSLPLIQDTKRIKYENNTVRILETKSPEYVWFFWTLLQENLLLRHNTRPTHTFTQIERLIDTFANDIRIFLAFDNTEHIQGGLIFFNTLNGFHLQYMAVSNFGRKLSVGDLLINYSLEIALSEKYNFFNFGHSHEKNGFDLNYNLFSYKSKFGSELDEAIRWKIDLGKFQYRSN